jgi:endogenous inhibitor of DNA gyrase (YacG/DUF329 family)
VSTTIDCPKCGHEHDPDPEIQDMATQCCDECGFEFDVHVNFEPVYSTQCTECDFGDWEQRNANGTVVMRRWCKNCSGVEEKENDQ